MLSSVFNSRSIRSVYATAATADTADPDHLLGRIDFGLGLQRRDDPRHVVVSLDSLLDAQRSELWLSELPVSSGWQDGFGYSHNGEVMFGSVFLPESELVELERETLKLYVRLEQLLQRMGYPHYLRMWNFLAQINVGAEDHERYRQFSAGRNRALALKPDFERALPAATAIGMLEPGLVIYFLAGKQPGIPVENPRQVSAYRYPRQYGPRSPSFSRATLIGAGTDARLLVSGTASVVGHESLHAGNLSAQLDETMANLDAVLANAMQTHFPGLPASAAHAENLKLYIRNAADLDQLRPQLARLRGARQAPLLCLHGDVCRDDLLLEVEGIYAIDRGA